MEHIYYCPFSEQRAELRKQWNELISIHNPNRIATDWETYLNEAEVEIDLFEHYDLLPKEVQTILDKYFEEENDYNACCNLQSDLNDIGFNCEYGLDAEPFNLKRLSK